VEETLEFVHGRFAKNGIVLLDGFVKSPKTPFSVIPAKAGIQENQRLLDPGLRRGDGFGDFLRDHDS